MNFGTSKSTATSRSGLRGTAYEDRAAGEAYGQGRLMSNLNKQLFSSPDATMSFGREMLPGGKYGLGENVDEGVRALGDYQFGRASADAATRGQVNPENMSAVIGSSIQNMLPFLIPQLQQHQYAQFAAPQSLLQSAKVSADYWSRALGAQSDASSSSFNFGVAWPGQAPVKGTSSAGGP